MIDLSLVIRHVVLPVWECEGGRVDLDDVLAGVVVVNSDVKFKEHISSEICKDGCQGFCQSVLVSLYIDVDVFN